MKRAVPVRAAVALATLLVSVCIVLTTPAHLGLDLQGGTRMVLQTRDSPSASANRETTDRTVEVLRHRIDALGVNEPELTRSGENRIIVELPDVQDPREAAEVLGRTAQLTMHPVTGTPQQHDGGRRGQDSGRPSGTRVLKDETGRKLQLGAAAMTGTGVKDAKAELDTERGAGWFVGIDFQAAGKSQWANLTGKAACHPAGSPQRQVAIVLDNEVISAPQVESSVRCGTGISAGTTRITGQFSEHRAQELALLIKGGALPVPVDIEEQRTVGPSLGSEAITASALASVIGVALTSVFVIGVYRFFGLLAAVALASYGLISYAALLALNVTLTLPGLAGFVLAIGMAVDANVLVFERAREEYAAAPPGNRRLGTAVTAGFRNAWSAIADSNVTTLLAAGLLFFLGSGPVRGFGVTLALGVLASMVSALVVARSLADLSAGGTLLRQRPRLNGIGTLGRVRTWLTERNVRLLRRPRRWLAVSAVLVLLAGGGLLTRGLEFGVEFTGGRLTEYSTSRPVGVDAAREGIGRLGLPGAEVTRSQGDNISVRAGEVSDQQVAEIRSTLAELGGNATKLSDERIGPSLGDELRRNALIALGIALLAQLVYLAARFRWSFALSSVAAMAHDVVLLLGAFAWLGKPVDGVFLAALLTVIGYSVNDSVVLYDRVRELWGKARRTPFPEVANAAVLQTVPRTVNTGMGALFILAALAVLGGSTLTDFAVALLIGLVAGMYSTVFTAVPLAVELEAKSGKPPPRPVQRRKPRPAHTRRAARRGTDNPTGAQV